MRAIWKTKVFNYCNTLRFSKSDSMTLLQRQGKKEIYNLLFSVQHCHYLLFVLCELDSKQVTRPVVDICVHAASNNNVCTKMLVDKWCDKTWLHLDVIILCLARYSAAGIDYMMYGSSHSEENVLRALDWSLETP